MKRVDEMKSKLMDFIFVLMFTAVSSVFAGTVYIEDGLEHVDDTNYGRNSIRVDYNVDYDPGTQITFTGASRATSNLGIYGYHHACVVVDTLESYGFISMNGYSTATIHDGAVNGLIALNNSYIRVNGGTFVYSSKRVTAGDNGFCELNGLFDITYRGDDGNQTLTNITSGNLRDIFNLGTGSLGTVNFLISGSLANGDIWTDYNMRLCDYGNIAIVPEPATMALLGLGTLVLRMKKK